MTADTAIPPTGTGLPGTAAPDTEETGAGALAGATATAGADDAQTVSEQDVALLMLRRAHTFVQLARDRISDTQDKLKDFKEITKMLEEMRKSQERSGGHGHATRMPSKVTAFCNKWHIHLDTTAHDDYHTHSQWDYNIQSTKGLRDKWSDQLRVLMLKLKAVMNQVDSSISGASKAEDKSAHIDKQAYGD